MALVVLGLFALYLGWGTQLWWLLIPSVFFTFLLSFWELPHERRLHLGPLETTPFATLGELDRVYRQVGTFRKQRFSVDSQEPPKESRIPAWLARFQAVLFQAPWPLALIAMVFPERTTQFHVN